MRARLYSSWASSTWSLPSAVCAWAAKMSRMIAVRSITGTPSAASRLRSWRGESSSSQATRFASERGDLGLQLVELAGPEVGVRMRLIAPLDHLADGGDARGPQQLAQLGELLLAAVRAPPRSCRRADARVHAGAGRRLMPSATAAVARCSWCGSTRGMVATLRTDRGLARASSQSCAQMRSTASSSRSSGVVSEIRKKPSPLAP